MLSLKKEKDLQLPSSRLLQEVQKKYKCACLTKKGRKKREQKNKKL